MTYPRFKVRARGDIGERRPHSYCAEGIVSTRPIGSLESLDAIPYVGPSAFGKLLSYGLANTPCAADPDPNMDASSCALLRAANESSFEQLDDDARLDRRAASNIVAAQLPVLRQEGATTASASLRQRNAEPSTS